MLSPAGTAPGNPPHLHTGGCNKQVQHRGVNMPVPGHLWWVPLHGGATEHSEPSPEFILEVYLAPGLPKDAGSHPLCPQPCSLGRIQPPRFIYS